MLKGDDRNMKRAAFHPCTTYRTRRASSLDNIQDSRHFLFGEHTRREVRDRRHISPTDPRARSRPSAARCVAIRRLVEQQVIQPLLFDRQNLAEITSPDYPGERLVACFNPLLVVRPGGSRQAEERRRKREALLAATEKELARLAAEVARRKRQPLTAAAIALKAGRRVHHFKMAKHFELHVADGVFTYARRTSASSVEPNEQIDK